MRAIASLLLILTLSACTSVPTVLRELPPVELLQPCEEPSRALETTGDLPAYILDLIEALRGCNRDKALLREWAGDE